MTNKPTGRAARLCPLLFLKTMIVDSMTHEEVYQELARDRDAVTTWWRHQLYGLRRPMLKSTVFPRHFWREYTSVRKNHYLFFTRIFDKRMKVILTGIAVLRRTNEGTIVYTSWLNDQRLISPMVMLPHFWKRYAERAGVDKSGAELIRHYFDHNPHGADSHNQKIVGRSVHYKGYEHLTCCVTEGVLLGQAQGNLFIVRTFITYDMSCGLQKQELDSKREEILNDKEMYEQAKNFYL